MLFVDVVCLLLVCLVLHYYFGSLRFIGCRVYVIGVLWLILLSIVAIGYRVCVFVILVVDRCQQFVALVVLACWWLALFAIVVVVGCC